MVGTIIDILNDTNVLARRLWLLPQAIVIVNEKKAGRYFTTIFECSECIPTTYIHSFIPTHKSSQPNIVLSQYKCKLCRDVGLFYDY